MFSRKCPRVDELEALVMGRPVSKQVRGHVEQCALCGPIVAELRANTKLLEELREAATDSPDEATRERVLEICSRVAREAKVPPKR